MGNASCTGSGARCPPDRPPADTPTDRQSAASNCTSPDNARLRVGERSQNLHRASATNPTLEDCVGGRADGAIFFEHEYHFIGYEDENEQECRKGNELFETH